MDFSKYTTQELASIASKFDDLKRELEIRNSEELNDFPFEVGDVIHSKYDNDNILKIKEINEINVVADEIVIRKGGPFYFFEDELFDIDTTEWNEYVKIEDSNIFENLLNIINKYNDDVQQLNDDTYLKFKKELSSY